jgi:tryptophan 7-halogenase
MSSADFLNSAPVTDNAIVTTSVARRAVDHRRITVLGQCISMKSVLIVGGGTAGWITAGYLAQTLGAQLPDGVRITLVESADIGLQGLGEGTLPSVRQTLRRIGVDEPSLVRDCGTSFKQGAKFVHWRYPPGRGRPDHYLHSYEAPLNYAYHFDTMKLAALLRKQGVTSGVRHVLDTVDAVNLAEDGSIRSVTARAHGELQADLFIDCTGFRAQLIGAALGVPYTSCRSVLFCDTALVMQLPYERPDAPIASYTIATAHESGWMSEIGLDNRRGISNVYSSDHMGDARAEQLLRAHVDKTGGGRAGHWLTARKIRFEAGYREINWKRNCVAIGLSGGFFEPLEATRIRFTEVAAITLSNLFPWGGDLETAAKQYNQIMSRRYERALDFIKLHYCLSERRDSRFWLDNVDSASIPESLQELLRLWQHRPPGAIDIDRNVDLFEESSWQSVLYGMGYETDPQPLRNSN